VKSSSDAVAYPRSRPPDGLCKDRPRNVAQVRPSTAKCDQIRPVPPKYLPPSAALVRRPRAPEFGGAPVPYKWRIRRWSSILHKTREDAGVQAASGKNRQKLPLSLVSYRSERLTVTASEPYIGPLGCAAATARWRVREAPHCLHGDRASGHAHGHVRVTASNARGGCCLTSESEERETWTAESLRAACRAGASFA
jgi:hypothetical protein